MSFHRAFRNTLLGISFACASVVLGLTAHLTHHTLAENLPAYDFEIAGLLISLLTIIVFPLIYFSTRKDYAAVWRNISIIGLFWVLWIISTAFALPRGMDLFPLGCQSIPSSEVHWCHEFYAGLSLACSIWILLFIYLIGLVFMPLCGHMIYEHTHEYQSNGRML